MKITLQYFAGCPNWETTDRHLTTLIAEGLDASIDYEMIDNYETAAQRGFRGSPTVLRRHRSVRRPESPGRSCLQDLCHRGGARRLAHPRSAATSDHNQGARVKSW